MNTHFLAVNGSLMRGFELNENLTRVGARFVRETRTAPVYRLWSINDLYPAMARVTQGGVAITVEVWEMTSHGLVEVLLLEPPGLCIGKLMLEDKTEVLGVLGEPAFCEGQKEISQYGGWRAYRMR